MGDHGRLEDQLRTENIFMGSFFLPNSCQITSRILGWLQQSHVACSKAMPTDMLLIFPLPLFSAFQFGTIPEVQVPRALKLGLSFDTLAMSWNRTRMKTYNGQTPIFHNISNNLQGITTANRSFWPWFNFLKYVLWRGRDMDADSQLKRVPAVKPIKRLEEAVIILVYFALVLLRLALRHWKNMDKSESSHWEALEKLEPEKLSPKILDTCNYLAQTRTHTHTRIHTYI